MIKARADPISGLYPWDDDLEIMFLRPEYEWFLDEEEWIQKNELAK